MQIADAITTLPAILFEVIPAILVAIAIVKRKRLDSARWLVAILAFLNALVYWISNVAAQGVRFTHWTLADQINAPLFTLNGNPFSLPTILRTLLFVSIVYAVIHYTIESRRRQTAIEQELQNARELQQVLVPETIPALPDSRSPAPTAPHRKSAATSSRSFPFENGSTLIVLGDVSGKGLRAAMAVSHHRRRHPHSGRNHHAAPPKSSPDSTAAWSAACRAALPPPSPCASTATAPAPSPAPAIPRPSSTSANSTFPAPFRSAWAPQQF